MKKRLGDRRSRPRFDVVGSLTGQIETWSRFEVHDVGWGGALIESSIPLAPGIRLGGSLSAGGEQCRVRAQVAHARPVTADLTGRYLVGLQWIDSSVPIPDLISILPSENAAFRSRAVNSTDAGPFAATADRRRSARIPAPETCEVSLCVTATATVVDISAGGLLFSSPVRLDPGAMAQLRLRLGTDDFSSQIEVHRTVMPETGDWRMGASFVLVDEASRRALDALLYPKQ